jgi:DNA-directed RNA polymerase specialized sigma subunit
MGQAWLFFICIHDAARHKRPWLPLASASDFCLFKIQKTEELNMSKNHSSEKDAEHLIYLDGKYIPVSKEVYLAYHGSARKIRYFQEDLKVEKLVVDQKNRRVTFLPSREDSLERLTENQRQEFADSVETPEELLVRKCRNEELWDAVLMLPPKLSFVITEVFRYGKALRTISDETGIPVMTLQHRKEKALSELKKILKDF